MLLLSLVSKMLCCVDSLEPRIQTSPVIVTEEIQDTESKHSGQILILRVTSWLMTDRDKERNPLYINHQR